MSLVYTLIRTCWASHTMGPPYVPPNPAHLEEAHILVGGRGEKRDGGGRRWKGVVEGRRESGINDAQAVDPVSAFAG